MRTEHAASRANCQHGSLEYSSAPRCADPHFSTKQRRYWDTKDRRMDLEATLTTLNWKGFSALETVVIDDSSLRPAPIG